MKNEIKMGSILSYLQMALSIVIGVLYTPIMIKLLGQSEYGLYNTVASTISMLSLLSLGFNSGYIRYYTRYKVKRNTEAINRLNGLFLIIFGVIALIAMMCGLYISKHLTLIFSDGLTKKEYDIAFVLMVISTISLAISFVNSVFTSIIAAHEKFIFQKLISMITTVASPMVTLPMLLMGYRSIALVSVSLGLTVLSTGINLYYVIRKLREKFWFHQTDNKLFVEIFTYTIFIAINLIIDQINWNIDKLLLGRFKGTVAVAIYSVGSSLYSYYASFSVSISNVFTPRIHNIVNHTKNDLEKQRKQLTDIFIKVGRIQFLILALIISGFIFFGKEFITKIWAGSDYTESYYVALLLMIPATIALIQNLGIEIQRAENKHQFRSIVYTGMAIVNLILSVFLCQEYGAIGSAFGTAISLIIANGIIMNFYYQKKCNIDIMAFWKNIIQLSFGLIIPIIAGIILTRNIPYGNILLFLIKIVVYVVIYSMSMYFLGTNDFEKSLIVNLIQKIDILKLIKNR